MLDLHRVGVQDCCRGGGGGGGKTVRRKSALASHLWAIPQNTKLASIMEGCKVSSFHTWPFWQRHSCLTDPRDDARAVDGMLEACRHRQQSEQRHKCPACVLMTLPATAAWPAAVGSGIAAGMVADATTGTLAVGPVCAEPVTSALGAVEGSLLSLGTSWLYKGKAGAAVGCCHFIGTK